MRDLPKVVIVGRPNVGKSSLFNRLAGKRKSIVDPQSGVTRDRVYAEVDWDKRVFSLIDTGGISFEKNCTISQRILQQVQFGIDEASVIIFLVDGKEGVNPYDKEIQEFLRGYSKPIILAVNKIDIVENMSLAGEFYQLGFERIFPISATHGLGLDDLLMEVVEDLPVNYDNIDETYDKITIVGKPNVGKSTLLNALLNEERAMVDSVPGTTRDAIDTKVLIDDIHYILVDTAGIRHKKKFDNNVESYAFMRTQEAIKRSDVVIMVMDAVSGIARQDSRVLSMVVEYGKSIILVINKWDLVKDMEKKEYLKAIEPYLKFVSYVPVVFISAKFKSNLNEILKNVPVVLEQSKYKIKTPDLNKVCKDALSSNPPPLINGKRLKIYYVVQTGSRPPVFTLFVNDGKYMTEHYRRYLSNRIRSVYSFYGAPIVLKTKSS